MSAPEQQIAERFHLAETPNSVGEYLATPSGVPPAQNWARLAALAAVLSLTGAAVILIFGGSLQVEIGTVAQLHTVDLMPLVPMLGYIGFALLVVALILFVISKLSGSDGVDLRAEVEKATLRIMLDQPRFGVERSTPLRSVKLHSRYIRGMQWQAVMCWSARYRFSDSDFCGANAAQFGGVDMLVRSGRLYVFSHESAKEKWLNRGVGHA